MRELIGDLKGVQQVNRLRTTDLEIKLRNYLIKVLYSKQRYLLFQLESLKSTYCESEQNSNIETIERNRKLCTKVDYFLFGHNLSWAIVHFNRCNGIKMQSKQILHNGIKRNKQTM